MAVFPSPGPPSRRVAGNRLGFSFGGSRPCKLGAFSCFGVEVTAADRAAATFAALRNAGGGRFSKRSPSPGPPPEEWLGIGLVLPSAVRAHASWARFLVLGLRSRRRWGWNPSARFAGTSPFRGGFFVRSNSIGRMLRAKHVLPTLRPPAPKHRPSLKTVRFQRSR